MKKITVCAMIMCVMLSGCGTNAELLNDSEKNKEENIQNNIVESEKPPQEKNENITGEVKDSVEQNENIEKHTETEEEYIERIKNTYSEIKEEVAAIGAEKPEILFNEIPWGSSYTLSKEKMKSTDRYLSDLAIARTYLLTRFVCGNKPGKLSPEGQMQYIVDDKIGADIGGASVVDNGDKTVAGYTIKSCSMYFIGVLKDEKYAFSEDDSALYAATYVIENSNVQSVREDLITKISSIYGEPDSTRYMEPDSMEQEYIYWYGANDTVLVLTSNNSGKITISYVWLGGEELLNAALNSTNKKESEESVYGNGNTDGL